MHIPHALRRFNEEFAPTEVSAIARVFRDDDIISQTILFVAIQPLCRLRRTIDDIGPRPPKIPFCRDRFLYVVLNLLNGRMPARSIEKLQHVCDTRGDMRHLRKGRRVHAVPRRRIIAIRIISVEMLPLVKSQRDGARNFGGVPRYCGPVTFFPRVGSLRVILNEKFLRVNCSVSRKRLFTRHTRPFVYKITPDASNPALR